MAIMGKKGQGLSIETIIIAIIVILVLVVLAAIFTGSFTRFTNQVSECRTAGGTCEKSCTGEFQNELSQYSAKCREKSAETPYCCASLSS